MTSRRPATPPLMGLAEIGEALGLSKQRVNGIRHDTRENFPPPWVTLRCGPVWKTEDVHRWIAEHRPDKAATPAPPPARPKVGLDGFCRGCQEPAAYCTCDR